MDSTPQGYTVAQAARRAGCSPDTIRSWVKKKRIRAVAGEGTLRVVSEDIERERRTRLAMFDQVADQTSSWSAADGGPAHEVQLQSRVRTLEAQLRDVAASRASVNEGLMLLLRGEQGLLDAVLRTLPIGPEDAVRSMIEDERQG